MKKAKAREAKTDLSKPVEPACDDNTKVIVRKGGAWKGKATIEEDFDVLPDELMKYFNC